MKPMAYIFMAAGLFAVAGAWFNWDWFIQSRKAWLFVKLFGRNGARGFYAVLGAALVVLGILMVSGVIPEPRRAGG